MKKDYVVCKGKRYSSGDTMDILWYTNGYTNVRPYTATFLDCDEDKDEYRFIVDGLTYCWNKVCFYQIVPNNKKTKSNIQHPKTVTFKNELNIDGMIYAWMWYILLMAIFTIFNGRIIFWIVTTIIFTNYRNKKLREAGYKL